MKYIEEFRDQALAQGLARAIAAEVRPERHYHLMEFCGGHTHAVFRYGVADLMPPNLKFIHGPGCPVCVLPVARIDQALALVRKHDPILCTYADLMRVPASKRDSLQKLKAEGGDVRMVYSSQDALRIADQHPDRQVVFFAIGFETTTPPTAVALRQARALGLENFSVFCNHVLTPAAIRHLLEQPTEDGDSAPRIDGIIGPAHVSTIIGSQPYEFCARDYGQPVVIAGFEPLDLMQAALMLVRQVNEGRHQVENEYTRAVTPEGNTKAQWLVQEVFELRDTFEWRGLGFVKDSALGIRPEFAELDAERRFSMPLKAGADVKGCECPAILRGVKGPMDCKLFGQVCTPENPMGACMVSSEGACAAYWSYGRFRGEGAAIPNPATSSLTGANP
jgi:hydrogenase expression/formation protein HypD